MNQKEKLVKVTIEALTKKLNEDNDINKYYRDFSRKVKEIIQQLTRSTKTMDTRTKNVITIEIPQMYLINRKDCQNYIQKQAKVPFIQPVNYKIDQTTKEKISNEEFDKAIDYVDNKYIPTLKNYMDSHSKECTDLIQQTFKQNNINIENIKDTAEISSIYEEYKYNDVKTIVSAILKEWENPNELYPYQHIYIITIDINNNKDVNTEDSNKYKVSFNPNYREYTVRNKNNGKVYFVSKDANEAYNELDRLNNGGLRGSEIKPVKYFN